MKDNKDKKPSFYSDTRKTFRILIVTVSFLGAFAWANLGLNIFTSGTTISSADMNDNFDRIENAIYSNLIINNPANTTLTDPNSCKYPAEIIKLDVTGSEVTNYNGTTGEFTFNESGIYSVIRLMKCDSCSKVDVYLCTDDGQAADACTDDTKAEKMYLGDINSSNNTGYSSFINIDSAKTYKLVTNLCGDLNFSLAGNFQIYFKKVR